MKFHKPWFHEEFSRVLAQTKQDKMQWLQETIQNNKNNLNNVRHEVSRHFKNKKNEYLEAKVDEIETNTERSKILMTLRTVTSLELI